MLFYNNVINGVMNCRGAPAVHVMFDNKVAIFTGYYLLARASIFLARLRDVYVVEIMSGVIEHLVRGEIMQMRGVGGTASGGGWGWATNLRSQGGGVRPSSEAGGGR